MNLPKFNYCTTCWWYSYVFFFFSGAFTQMWALNFLKVFIINLITDLVNIFIFIIYLFIVN